MVIWTQPMAPDQPCHQPTCRLAVHRGGRRYTRAYAEYTAARERHTDSFGLGVLREVAVACQEAQREARTPEEQLLWMERVI